MEHGTPLKVFTLYSFYRNDFSYIIAQQFYAVQILNKRFDIVVGDNPIHLIV